MTQRPRSTKGLIQEIIQVPLIPHIVFKFIKDETSLFKPGPGCKEMMVTAVTAEYCNGSYIVVDGREFM